MDGPREAVRGDRAPLCTALRRGRFQADAMSAREIVALMEALSVFGLQREIISKAA